MAELSFGDYRILRATENSSLILVTRTREMTLDAGAITVAQARARRIGPSPRPESPEAAGGVRSPMWIVAQPQRFNTAGLHRCNDQERGRWRPSRSGKGMPNRFRRRKRVVLWMPNALAVAARW